MQYADGAPPKLTLAAVTLAFSSHQIDLETLRWEENSENFRSLAVAAEIGPAKDEDRRLMRIFRARISSMNSHRCWYESSEQDDKSVSLNDHANKRISEKHHGDSNEEWDCRFELVSLKEEVVRPMKSNYACQSTDEQDL